MQIKKGWKEKALINQIASEKLCAELILYLLEGKCASRN